MDLSDFGFRFDDATFRSRGSHSTEDIQVCQPDRRRDATRHPVMDALDSTLRGVKFKLPGHFGLAAKGLDDFCIHVFLAHGAD